MVTKKPAAPAKKATPAKKAATPKKGAPVKKGAPAKKAGPGQTAPPASKAVPKQSQPVSKRTSTRSAPLPPWEGGDVVFHSTDDPTLGVWSGDIFYSLADIAAYGDKARLSVFLSGLPGTSSSERMLGLIESIERLRSFFKVIAATEGTEPTSQGQGDDEDA